MTDEIKKINAPGDLKFSPDNKYLISGGEDSAVGVWSLDNKEHIGLLKSQHQSRVVNIIFNSDGKYFASKSEDGVVGIWDINGLPLGYIDPIEEGWSETIRFSNDSQYLVSAGKNGFVRLFPLSLENLMKESCKWLYFYINAHPEEKENLCPGLSISESYSKG